MGKQPVNFYHLQLRVGGKKTEDPKSKRKEEKNNNKS
jgi:hypothetical protein